MQIYLDRILADHIFRVANFEPSFQTEHTRRGSLIFEWMGGWVEGLHSRL